MKKVHHTHTHTHKKSQTTAWSSEISDITLLMAVSSSVAEDDTIVVMVVWSIIEDDGWSTSSIVELWGGGEGGWSTLWWS